MILKHKNNSMRKIQRYLSYTQCVRFNVIYHIDAQIVRKYQNYIKHNIYYHAFLSL